MDRIDSSIPEKKRVRTGCQTCRIRHLKCDEAKPECSQCVKGKRRCTYEKLLRWDKYLDVQKIPNEVPITNDFSFKDESVLIASEYVGGTEWYREFEVHRSAVSLQSQTRPQRTANRQEDPMSTRFHAAVSTESFQPGQHRPALETNSTNVVSQPHLMSRTVPSYYSHNYERVDNWFDSQLPLPADYLPVIEPLEAHFMQVFIEEMGKWMDTMNATNYFSNRQAYESRAEPMLYKAFLACGAAHQLMIYPDKWDASYHKSYYDSSYAQFDVAVGTFHSNSMTVKKELVAQTSVILAVYSTLVLGKDERIHILKLSRDLMKDCGWSATSSGPEGAYYWLHRGMELLTCLNLRVKPTDDHHEDEKLGLTFTGARDTTRNMESLWTRKIVCIVSQIVNKLLYPGTNYANPEELLHVWNDLSSLIEGWHQSVPITMLPLWKFPAGHLGFQADGSTVTSAFPRIYLPERPSVFARIWYHTGWVVLARTHPFRESSHYNEMKLKELDHARDICGIAKHTNDRALASVMIRPCLMAAECMAGSAERNEAMSLLEDFKTHTGWQLDPALKKLRKDWEQADHRRMATIEMNTRSTAPLSNSLQSTQINHPMTYQTHQSITQAFNTQHPHNPYINSSLEQQPLQTNQRSGADLSISHNGAYLTPSQSALPALETSQRTSMPTYTNQSYAESHSLPAVYPNYSAPAVQESLSQQFMNAATSTPTQHYHSGHFQQY